MSSEQTWTHGLERALEGGGSWAERPGRETPRPAEPTGSRPERGESRLPAPELQPYAAAGGEVRPAGQTLEENPAFISFVETLCRGDRICLKRLMDTLERLIIIRALDRCRGNQRIAAFRLGLKYTTLNEKVKKHGLRYAKSIKSGESWTAR